MKLENDLEIVPATSAPDHRAQLCPFHTCAGDYSSSDFQALQHRLNLNPSSGKESSKPLPLSSKAGHSWECLDIKHFEDQELHAVVHSKHRPRDLVHILPMISLCPHPCSTSNPFIKWTICCRESSSLDGEPLWRCQAPLNILSHSNPDIHPIDRG